MLPANIVDNNTFKIYFVSFSNEANIAFDTALFHEIDKKQIYTYHSWP